jgi:hypothetical protein
VITQSVVKGGGLLKDARVVDAEFLLKAAAPSA